MSGIRPPTEVVIAVNERQSRQYRPFYRLYRRSSYPSFRS